MGQTAHAIAHYEAALKGKDERIAAQDTTIQRQQAALNQLTERARDADDEASLLQARARFPDMDTPPA